MVKRFELDPGGRAFLPVSDILRAHRLINESLDLLQQGVARHPAFTVARVVLARELFSYGQIERAWQVLAESPLSLHENVLAQKLRFKLGAVLGLVEICQATYQHLVHHRMVDQEIKRLAEVLESDGKEALRSRLEAEFKEKNIEMHLPQHLPADSETWAPGTGTVPHASVTGRVNGDRIESFHVVPLSEVFQPADRAGRDLSSGGVEMDSTTLCEIFAKQGHYSKSLAMYRRLVKLSPNNELYRRRIGDLMKLERDQKDTDMSVDPALVDKMETIELLDRQMRFLNAMLAGLPPQGQNP